MNDFVKKMKKFKAYMDILINFLLNNEFPPGYTENQKKTLRRQRESHMIKGKEVFAVSVRALVCLQTRTR